MKEEQVPRQSFEVLFFVRKNSNKRNKYNKVVQRGREQVRHRPLVPHRRNYTSQGALRGAGESVEKRLRLRIQTWQRHHGLLQPLETDERGDNVHAAAAGAGPGCAEVKERGGEDREEGGLRPVEETKQSRGGEVAPPTTTLNLSLDPVSVAQVKKSPDPPRNRLRGSRSCGGEGGKEEKRERGGVRLCASPERGGGGGEGGGGAPLELQPCCDVLGSSHDRFGNIHVCVFHQVWLLPVLEAVKVSPLIEKVSDHKDFKKLLRTRTNVLVIYTKTATSGDSHLKLLSDVAQTVKGQGTIAWVNCGDSEGRKLCKKVKVDPSSKHGGTELLHYKDGTFHTEYNRPATFKSMVAFLKDPSGPPLWEENPEAKDVVHIETEKDFRKLLKKEERPVLMMFYAPFIMGAAFARECNPSFSKRPRRPRGNMKGKFLHHYENYGATAKDIADWMKNPQPPQPKTPEVPWSETDSAVFHLTDDTFDSFLGGASRRPDHVLRPLSRLLSFGPALLRVKELSEGDVAWCGHCKKMKPEYDEAAEVLNKGADSPGVLAAVDATVHKAVGDRFKISGFPTVKYFQNGEEKYTLPHLRSKDKIIEFMHNPQAPPPPEQSWEDKPSSVSHLGSDDFREALKKKKHALVMFYAPWCPHCKNAVPHFTTAAELFKEDRKIVYAAVDCTKGQNHELCKQEGVEGYPTFNHYNYGKFVEKYNGDRGEAGFTGFMRSLRGRDQEKVVKRKEEL
ncbi:hypothetical protein L3Q82_017338 [Scortum barcoo]|uniref:Uncharacterized protein n=1 Tax=Scortum barcoo TaxID=214431 RepID=A0ACB8VK72_9TELE|nr:hypothetical protein L3Q82_017338 [Scortum barcoo]